MIVKFTIKALVRLNSISALRIFGLGGLEPTYNERDRADEWLGKGDVRFWESMSVSAPARGFICSFSEMVAGGVNTRSAENAAPHPDIARLSTCCRSFLWRKFCSASPTNQEMNKAFIEHFNIAPQAGISYNAENGREDICPRLQ